MVAISSESKPMLIMITANSRVPMSVPGSTFFSSIEKNLYTLKPNVMSEVAVRIHANIVRS